jgi:hypothetical protein
MIIDCFPYFNEKELLELRLRLLYDHVDKFVISEGTRTHRGMPKSLTAYQTIKDLGISMNKIELVAVNMPDPIEEPDDWVRERMQRDVAAKYITDGVIAHVSDCDEILNPAFINEFVDFVKNSNNTILRVPLVYLAGAANFRVYMTDGKPVLWPTPFVCAKHHVERYSLSCIREDQARNQHLITDYEEVFPVINGSQLRDAGWHFTWMGGSRKRHVKFKNFLHNNEYTLNEKFIPCVGGTDPLGRKDHLLKEYPLEELPKLIFELENVKNFLLPTH